MNACNLQDLRGVEVKFAATSILYNIRSVSRYYIHRNANAHAHQLYMETYNVCTCSPNLASVLCAYEFFMYAYIHI